MSWFINLGTAAFARDHPTTRINHFFFLRFAFRKRRLYTNHTNRFLNLGRYPTRSLFIPSSCLIQQPFQKCFIAIPYLYAVMSCSVRVLNWFGYYLRRYSPLRTHTGPLTFSWIMRFRLLSSSRHRGYRCAWNVCRNRNEYTVWLT